MKITAFIKIYILILILISVHQPFYGQIFNPEIENYSIENYEASNQNWGIDIDDNGEVFVANNKGLLKYNGQTWKLFELPNKTIVRSVLCVNDKIYTGSYEEFGYWSKNNFGEYTYNSLIPLFDKNHQFKSEEFWQIVNYKNFIIFKSFRGIYTFDGEQITYIENSQEVSEIVVYNNKVVVGSWNGGLKELKEGRLIPYKILKGKAVFKPISILTSFRENLFFYDINSGGYIFNGINLFQLSNELNHLLSEYVINKVVFINDYTIAFGTIKNGVLIYNIETKSIQYIDKEAGLKNNTVLGLKFKNGNIWSALDNGIGRIDYENPVNYYLDLSGVLGTVYDVAYFENCYYLASNTGLYSFTEDHILKFIDGSEGQVWDLSIIDNQLICGHNFGTYYVDKNGLHPIDLKMGGVFSKVKIPEKENWFLQSAYSGINLLRKNDGVWKSQLLGNISFPVNNVVFESDSIIWATHPYKGIYRIELNKDYTQAKDIKSFGSNNYFKQYKTSVYNVNDTVVFYNSKKWFQYFKDGDSIGVYKKFQKFKNKELIGRENKGFWFIDRKKTKEFLFVNDKFEEVFHLQTPEIEKRVVSDYEKIIVKNDSIRIINLNDGIAIVNLNKLKKNLQLIRSKPFVDIAYSGGTKFLITNNSKIDIPFKYGRSLTFEFHTPHLYKNNHSYKLEGEINQQDVIVNGKLMLQNLAYGDYILTIKNVGDGKGEQEFNTYYFKILPPWYLSIFMKVIYALFVIGSLSTVFKFNRIKIRKQQIKLQQQYIRATQKKINKIEKENLEKEVNNKKRELINTTASIIKKNEIIILLRTELMKLLDVSPNQYRSKRLLEMSNDYINNDKDWKIFESNFNELNEDFFKSLISKFPKLTSKDLKLCAYIKTGLTSREIAPLMGISLRGVELHRYRLRKKINLTLNDSLTNFLMLL